MNKKTKITLIASVATLAVFGALKLKKFIKSRLTTPMAPMSTSRTTTNPTSSPKQNACECETRQCSPRDEAPCECASGR